MGEIGNAFKFLSEDNIKMDLKETVYEGMV
jgi:hypothetical protein